MHNVSAARWRDGLAHVVVVGKLSSLTVIVPAGSASTEIDPFPDGTEVEVAIDTPADGSSPVDGRGRRRRPQRRWQFEHDPRLRDRGDGEVWSDIE